MTLLPGSPSEDSGFPNDPAPSPVGDDEDGRREATAQTVEARIAAFYLPQFHRVPENDKWWGEGFTEWTNVRRAVPFFEGHRQPQLPGELGYYDLLDPEVHHRQQELAQAHGISAFCYYVYWFGGLRLLERPLGIVLDEDLPLDYFLCWANENWTRTWDGFDEEVLMAQHHDAERDAGIIDDLAPHLANPRYLRIDGKPLFVVYRASLMDEPMRTADNLRARAQTLGLGDLHLSMVQSFGGWDPRPMGFDSAIEFPPHNWQSDLFRIGDDEKDAPKVFDPDQWQGGLYSYPRVIEWAMSKNLPEFTWFRGLMPSWDNTPRRLERASAFIHDTPQLFQTWLERVLHSTYLFNSPEHWLVLVNSWNEWGEGAYLEPDCELGLARLEAVLRARRNTAPLARTAAAAWADRTQRGDLLDTARAYFKSAAVLARETLCHWYAC